MSKFGYERLCINSHNLLDMRPERVLQERFITVDDTFQFHCKACGRCCQNRDPITLTAYDVYRLARFFSREPSEFISQYCEIVESSVVPFPYVYLLMRAGTCPFLRNKKCFVHTAKPGVCRCFPLGRVFFHDDAGAYFNVNSTTCKHEPREVKVRDWIADFATEEADSIGQLWNSSILAIIYSMTTEKAFRKANQERRKNIRQFIFSLLYLAYDIKAPFYPQLEKNVSTLRELMAEQYGFNIISVEDYRKAIAADGCPLSPPNSTRREHG